MIPRNELPTLDTWLNCEAELCPFIVHQTGFIEDAGNEAVEVYVLLMFIEHSHGLKNKQKCQK